MAYDNLKKKYHADIGPALPPLTCSRLDCDRPACTSLVLQTGKESFVIHYCIHHSHEVGQTMDEVIEEAKAQGSWPVEVK